VRCQGCGGSLVEVTGKAINDAFTSYMLARPPGFNPQSNIDCAIMCTSVASVKLTNDCEGGTWECKWVKDNYGRSTNDQV
jgi:hypothetical protein